MTDEPREELISAYLDDELSPEERAQVESWLSANPQMRQLRDELAAVRASMQALGRHKLDRELAPAVLRRAERTVLAGPAIKAATASENGVQDSSAHEGAAHDRHAVSIGSWWHRGAGWRRMIWPAAALAAALAILLYDRGQNLQREVARAPQNEALKYTNAPASTESAPTELDSTVADGVAGQQVESLIEGKLEAPAAAKDDARPTDSYYQQPQLRSLRQKRMDAQPPAGDEAGVPVAPGAAPQVDRALQLGAGAQPMQSTSRFGYTAQPLYEFEVTPEFLSSGAFDKLLAEKNISRLEQQRQRARKLQESSRDEKVAATTGDYEVEGTSEQIDELLTALQKDPAVKAVPAAQVAGRQGLRRSIQQPVAREPGAAVPLQIKRAAPPAEARGAQRGDVPADAPAEQKVMKESRATQELFAIDAKRVVRFRLRTPNTQAPAEQQPAAPPPAKPQPADPPSTNPQPEAPAEPTEGPGQP